MNLKKNIFDMVFFLFFLSTNAFADDLNNINDSNIQQKTIDHKLFGNYVKQTQKSISHNIQLTDKPQIYNVYDIINPVLINSELKEEFISEKQNKNIIPDIKYNQQDALYEIKHIEQTKNESFVEKYSNITKSILSQGIEYIGIPYKWGGNTELSGFDCSGYVRAVFQNSIGLNLPRTAKEMSNIGEKIQTISNINPGDLVFFNTMKKNFSHVGIYLGDNKFLHAPKKGENVKITNIDNSYWVKRFNGARRILNSETTEVNIK
jgi:cell wall-associated NlpC family hydrolase